MPKTALAVFYIASLVTLVKELLLLNKAWPSIIKWWPHIIEVWERDNANTSSKCGRMVVTFRVMLYIRDGQLVRSMRPVSQFPNINNSQCRRKEHYVNHFYLDERDRATHHTHKDVLHLGLPFHVVLHTSTPMHGQRTECSSDGECSLKLAQH